MIVHSYSLYDRKALSYSPPFFMASDGLALRALHDLVLDTSTTVGRHPSDFVLYRVGRWNDETGALEPLSPLQHVMDATAVLELKTNV